jgi:membrane protein
LHRTGGGCVSAILARAVANPLSFPARVYTRLRDIHLARTAGRLAFTTLLALVPLTSVALAFVARFPIFGRALSAFETFLIRHFLPPSAAALVHENILAFAAQAARLSGVAVVLVFVTAGMAIYTVEREINAIWGVRHGRPLARRVIVYLLCMTLGPVLVGAIISLTTWAIVHSLAAVPFETGLDRSAVAALPFAFSALGLTLVDRFVPARRVRVGPAVVGGVLAAAALEIAKHLFALYLARVPTYRLVYGALAALPIFMVWVYVGWIVVLAGAAVTATLAEGGRGR